MVKNSATSSPFEAFTILHCVCAGAQAALSALYQSVQARRATHEPLLALSGRLELVRAQLDKATNDVHMHIKPQVLCHFLVPLCLIFLRRDAIDVLVVRPCRSA